ncbi:hypothetical protein CHUAL_010378 [Chamberlinius hualienensis]
MVKLTIVSIVILAFLMVKVTVTKYSVDKHTYTVMCYLRTWTTVTKVNGRYDISFFNPTHCTHLIYLRLGINEATYEIKANDPNYELNVDGRQGKIATTTKLKLNYHHLKVLVSIGGWPSDKDLVTHRKMTSSATNRQIFVKSVVNFLEQYNLDGIEIDFRYMHIDRNPANTEDFVALLQELNSAFIKNEWTLIVLLSAIKKEVYNVQKISNLVTFINIMTYDFRGHWDNQTGHNSPLYSGRSSALWNVDETVKNYIALKADYTKINVGIPFYGRTFHMSSSKTDVGASANGPANISTSPGLIPYNELCLMFSTAWCIKRDYESHAPYAYRNHYWATYDDTSSVTEKVQFVVDNHLSGVFINSIDMDDINGSCHVESMNLLSTVNKIFEKEYKKKSTLTPDYIRDHPDLEKQGNIKTSGAFVVSSAVNILTITIAFPFWFYVATQYL